MNNQIITNKKLNNKRIAHQKRKAKNAKVKVKVKIKNEINIDLIYKLVK